MEERGFWARSNHLPPGWHLLFWEHVEIMQNQISACTPALEILHLYISMCLGNFVPGTAPSNEDDLIQTGKWKWEKRRFYSVLSLQVCFTVLTADVFEFSALATVEVCLIYNQAGSKSSFMAHLKSLTKACPCDVAGCSMLQSIRGCSWCIDASCLMSDGVVFVWEAMAAICLLKLCRKP